MYDKKDPGKFTIRFNAADPQQMAAIEFLNQHGRNKAQFLANAILHYVNCDRVVDTHNEPGISTAQIERIVKHILSEKQPPEQVEAVTRQNNNSTEPMDNTGRNAILQTMQAFSAISPKSSKTSPGDQP